MISKKKVVSWAGIFLVLTLLVCVMPVTVSASGTRDNVNPADVRTLHEVYRTTDPEEKRYFPERRTFDGWTGELKEVTYEVLKEEPVTEMRVCTETVELPWNREIPEPDKILEKDGLQYELVDTEVTETSVTGRSEWVTGKVEYLGYITEPEVDESIVTEYRDPVLNETIYVRIPFEEIYPVEYSWRSDVTFSLTIDDVAAYYYELGGEWIPTDQLPGEKHYPAIMELLDLDPEIYRIDALRWEEESGVESHGEDHPDADISESYDPVGDHSRKITGLCSRYTADYQADYAGEVALPDIPGYQVKAVYRTEQEVETGTTLYTIQASAIYQKEVEFPIIAAVTAGGTVTGSVLFFVLFLRRRKRKVH